MLIYNQSIPTKRKIIIAENKNQPMIQKIIHVTYLNIFVLKHFVLNIFGSITYFLKTNICTIMPLFLVSIILITLIGANRRSTLWKWCWPKKWPLLSKCHNFLRLSWFSTTVSKNSDTMPLSPFPHVIFYLDKKINSL